MRKIFFILLLTIFTSCSFMNTNLGLSENKIEIKETEDGSVCLIVKNVNEKFDIPEFFLGKKVTEIHFADINENNKISTLTVPETILKIDTFKTLANLNDLCFLGNNPPKIVYEKEKFDKEINIRVPESVEEKYIESYESIFLPECFNPDNYILNIEFIDLLENASFEYRIEDDWESIEIRFDKGYEDILKFYAISDKELDSSTTNEILYESITFPMQRYILININELLLGKEDDGNTQSLKDKGATKITKLVIKKEKVINQQLNMKIKESKVKRTDGTEITVYPSSYENMSHIEK